MTLLSTLGGLSVEDGPADVPVQQEQLGVDHPRCPDSGLADLHLQVFEEVAVVVGQQSGIAHRAIFP